MEFKEAEETPLEPDEESHGVTVVVGAFVGGIAGGAMAALKLVAGGVGLPQGLATAAAGGAGGAGVAPGLATAAAIPPAIAATPAALPTPMPIFCGKVRPGATIAQGLGLGLPFLSAAAAMSKLSNTALRNDVIAVAFTKSLGVLCCCA